MLSGDDAAAPLFAYAASAPSPSAPPAPPLAAASQAAPQRAEIDSPATAQAIVETAAREAPADIVFPGPRVVPSLAGAKPMPQHAAASPAAAATPAPAVPADAAGPDGAGWIAAAFADARNVTRALQSGDTSVGPTAQPWVARAKLDALDKYETLVRSRGTAADPS
jgi:hypothetical protein